MLTVQQYHWTVWGMTYPDADEKQFCPSVEAATYLEALSLAKKQNRRFPPFARARGPWVGHPACPAYPPPRSRHPPCAAAACRRPAPPHGVCLLPARSLIVPPFTRGCHTSFET